MPLGQSPYFKGVLEGPRLAGAKAARAGGGGGGGGPTVNFKYAAGDSLAGWTTSRAGSATYYDVNGVVQTAGTNVMRDGHFLGGVRHFLFGAARTNAAVSPRDLTNAGWTKTLCTIGGSTTGADGTTITTAGIIANAGVVAAIVVDAAGYTWTASTAQAWACIGKPGSSSQFFIQTTRKDGTTIETSWVNLSTGAIGTKAAAHTIKMWPLANSCYRVELGLSSSGVGAVGATVAFGPADADNTLTVTGDGATVNCYADWVQVEQDQMWVTTPIVGASRVADVATKPHGSTPQQRTLYLNLTIPSLTGAALNAYGVDLGGNFVANGMWFRIASAGGNGPLNENLENNTTVVTAAPVGNHAIGDQMECRAAADATPAAPGGAPRNRAARPTPGSWSARRHR
jgi:hypothetical protein